MKQDTKCAMLFTQSSAFYVRT